MLSESQKLTVKVAVRRARERGAEAEEIRKLAAGMKVEEKEIRAYAEQTLGTTTAAPAEPESRILPVSDSKFQGKPQKGRREWSAEELQRLKQLRGEGKGPAEIARTLGCDSRHVANKIARMKLKPGAPAQPVKEPAEYPEYSALRAKLAEPEPSGINLAKELLDLMDHFELAYSAKPVLLQVSPSAGWAACSFDAAGRRYFVNLKAKRKGAAK